MLISLTKCTLHRPIPRARPREQSGRAESAAVAGVMVHFRLMNEAALRQWVEANPGRVNDKDEDGLTPLSLCVAALFRQSLLLVLWLLDEKGADVNATTSNDWTAFHDATSLDILIALLDRGADPTMLTNTGSTALMYQACRGDVDVVARLLQDPRVRATINVQDMYGNTPLHRVSMGYRCELTLTPMVHLLLQAGADPDIADDEGRMALAYLRNYHPTYHASIDLLEQTLADAEKASLLVKTRRVVVSTISTITPFYLQQRVASGQPLPQVAMAPLMGDQNDVDDGEGRKLRTMLTFVLGMGGGPEGGGMPRDVFRVVLDLLMPKWDPLQRGIVGSEMLL